MTHLKLPARKAVTVHLLPYRGPAVYSIGIQLHPNRLGVKIIEKDLNLILVLLVMGLDLHLPEVQRGPFLFQLRAANRLFACLIAPLSAMRTW